MAIPFHSKIKDKKQVVEAEQDEPTAEEGLEYPAPLLDFVLKHIKVVLGCVAFFVVVIVAIGILNWRLDRKKSLVENKLGEILVKPISSEQLEELEQLFKTAPKSLKKGLLLQMAFVAISLGEYEKAADFYGKLRAGDPEGVVEVISGFNQADLFQRLGDWKEALKVLDSLEKVASKPLLSAVYEAQAVCAEQLGENEVAIAAYKKLINELTASGNDAVFYENRAAALTNS